MMPRVPRKCDTAEKILINGLALLKMLKHGKEGVPLEVIGILLGHKIDEFTIEVFDVFATPQIATGQSVETTDETFQVNMINLLSQTGYREDLVTVGWYHSHPGFDVWFSTVDYQNQETLERQDDRAVGIVVDPILSVRGKVVIGAFRNVPNAFTQVDNRKHEDPREKTSFIGHTIKPSPKTIHSGLNVVFYEMPIVFNMNEHEQHMLSSLHRPTWSKGYEIPSFVKEDKNNLQTLKDLTQCAENYRLSILEEGSMKKSELELRHVGKVDPKQFMNETSHHLSNHEASLLARLHVTKAAF